MGKRRAASSSTRLTAEVRRCAVGLEAALHVASSLLAEAAVDCRTASEADALVGGVEGGRCGELRLLLLLLLLLSSKRRRASGPPRERGEAPRCTIPGEL